MQNPPRLDRLIEPICAADFSIILQMQFAFANNAGLTPADRFFLRAPTSGRAFQSFLFESFWLFH
jgi:hypothetical protein